MEGWRVVLLALVGVSAVVDLRSRRIPNQLTFGGAAAGLAYQGWAGGLAGIGHGIGGWAAGIALFLPMYLLRGMGAGDVKLLGAGGAWFGPMGAVWSALYTALAGGILALVVGGWHGYLGK